MSFILNTNYIEIQLLVDVKLLDHDMEMYMIDQQKVLAISYNKGSLH